MQQQTQKAKNWRVAFATWLMFLSLTSAGSLAAATQQQTSTKLLPNEDHLLASDTQRVFLLLNQQRMQTGVAPLTLNWQLGRIANTRSSLGTSLAELLKPLGISPTQVAELQTNLVNLSALSPWLRQQGAILNTPNWTRVGIGIAETAQGYRLSLILH